MSDSNKKITPREAAIAVLKKAEELYKATSLSKAEIPLEKKYEGFKAVEASARKSGASDPAAVAAAVGRKKYGKKAFQAAASAGRKMGKSEDGQNPDEKADAVLGEKVEQDVHQHESQNEDPGHEMPMKGHIKLAKFVGRMEHKRSMKKAEGQTLGAAIGYPGAPSTAPMPAPSPVAKSSK